MSYRYDNYYDNKRHHHGRPPGRPDPWPWELGPPGPSPWRPGPPGPFPPPQHPWLPGPPCCPGRKPRRWY